MAHLQVEVPEDMNTVVVEAVGRGDFATDSEVVTAALRLWDADRRLQDIGIGRKWDEAISANGAYVDADEVLDRLEEKYRALSEASA